MGGERIKVALVPPRVGTSLPGNSSQGPDSSERAIWASKVKGQPSSAGKVKKHEAESYSQPRTLLQKWWCPCLCLRLCCCILSASESFLSPASLCCSSHSHCHIILTSLFPHHISPLLLPFNPHSYFLLSFSLLFRKRRGGGGGGGGGGGQDCGCPGCSTGPSPVCIDGPRR